MRDILVIMGSPRAGGTTNALTDAFIKGAEEAGHRVTKFSLGQCKVNGCLGCNGCMRTGTCVQDDDMTREIYPKLLECDTVVMASPIYCYMCTALLKCFVERTYPMSMQPASRTRKDAILLMTAMAGGSVFKPTVEWHRANIGYIGWRDRGMVLAGGCGSTVPGRYLEEAYNLGKKL